VGWAKITRKEEGREEGREGEWERDNQEGGGQLARGNGEVTRGDNDVSRLALGCAGPRSAVLPVCGG
jgi:hypothetical protein